MRLIDADALEPSEMIQPLGNGRYEYVRIVYMDDIDEMPTIEPERKTGKWVNNIHDLPVCDQCGYMTPYDRAIDDYEYGNFCPNCGANMRGELNER